MNKNTRDTLLIIILLGSLLLVTAVATLRRFNEDGRRGSITSAEPDGAQRLAGRLAQQGYDVSRLDRAPAPRDVIFTLAPNTEYTLEESVALDNWVRAGGTLIIAHDDGRTQNLLNFYNLRLRRLWLPVNRTELALPALNWPPVGSVSLAARHRLALDCGQAAVHIGDCRRPFLVAFGRGRGQVFVLAAVYPFTNEGLDAPGNAQLALNLVNATAVPGSAIFFDETHHQPLTTFPLSWLFTTPEGGSLLYAFLLLILFTFWGSRSLRTAVSAAQSLTGPANPDIDAGLSQIADMQIESKQERTIQHHYWDRLKRKLAQKYRLDPALSDQELFAALSDHQDEVDLALLLSLAAALHNQTMTDLQLISWVDQVVALTEAIQPKRFGPTTRKPYAY